jgi:6,7-dimethyl-8-ribityllumazine synthase
MGKTFTGRYNAGDSRIAIVGSRFNDFIVRELMDGAMDCLTRHGVEESVVDVAWVPGSFEIPMAAKRLVETGRYAGVICLGCLIQGDTPHFGYISNEVTKGIAQLSLDSNIPVSFGVITADTLEQAIERAGTKAGNKGFDAALSVLEMIDLWKNIDKG